MKQLLIVAYVFLFVLVGCKKEEITTNPPTISNTSWHMIQTTPGNTPSSQTVVLNANNTVTGGTWSLSGTAFTMVKWSTTYSGVLSSNVIEGTTQSPTGTFRMTKQ